MGASSPDLAIGFRVKSGWAAAVLLAGPAELPRVLNRRIVELSDPADPESRQPYHADFGTLETSAAELRRRKKVIQRAAERSVAELVRDYESTGHPVRRTCLVVGSMTDPTTIAHPHIRAHALEGQLFRTVLQDSLQGRRMTCDVVLERELFARAARAIRRTESELKRMLSDLDRPRPRPWRADDKHAALAAWLTLVTLPS